MNDDFLKSLKAGQKHLKKDFSNVPEDYFEKLKTTMLKQVDEQNRIKMQWRRRLYSVAAASVLFVGLYFVWQYADTSKNQQFQHGEYAFTGDTMHKKSVYDTTNAFDQSIAADTLWLDEIPNEYLLLYLLEAEEFEF